MNEEKVLLSKWLRNLFYLHIASLAITLINAVTNLETITRFVRWAITVGVVLCLYQLRTANPRYQKSAIYRAVMLGGNLVFGLLRGPVFMTLVASVCSIISSYQEYHGHSELVAELDPKLSGKWSSLFTWSLLMGVITGFASYAVVMIGILAKADTELLTTAAVASAVLAEVIVAVLYLRNMTRTLALFED